MRNARWVVWLDHHDQILGRWVAACLTLGKTLTRYMPDVDVTRGIGKTLFFYHVYRDPPLDKSIFIPNILAFYRVVYNVIPQPTYR